MTRSNRYRKRVSDRSGFDCLERELVRDHGLLVSPDEYDTPPPSNLPLGGEGDVSLGEYCRTDYTDWGVDSSQLTVVQYLNTASTISIYRHYDASGQRNTNQDMIYICGSGSEMILSSNPQIALGEDDEQVTLECVGSAVTLSSGNGLSMVKSFYMDSGSLISFFYNTANNVWFETSRSHKTRSLGEL